MVLLTEKAFDINQRYGMSKKQRKMGNGSFKNSSYRVYSDFFFRLFLYTDQVVNEKLLDIVSFKVIKH